MQTTFQVGETITVAQAESVTGRAVKSPVGTISMILERAWHPQGSHAVQKYMVQLETAYGIRGYEVAEDYISR